MSTRVADIDGRPAYIVHSPGVPVPDHAPDCPPTCWRKNPPVMTHRCGIHGGEVPESEAEIVSWSEAGSGPGIPAYSCISCICAEGIVPPQPGIIERRELPPIVDGSRLLIPQPSHGTAATRWISAPGGDTDLLAPAELLATHLRTLAGPEPGRAAS